MNENRTRQALALLMTVAAGCVDAFGFLNAGVFPANMTGNSVVLALGLVHASRGGATLAGLVLLGFCIGAAVTAWCVRSPKGAWSRGVSAAIVVAGVILLGSVFVMRSGLMHAGIIGISVAMGIQSVAVLRLNIPGASSTIVVTSTLTTAIVRMAGGARTAALGHPNADGSPWFPALIWSSYFAGALISGLQSVFHLAAPAFLPGILLLVVAITAECRLAHRR